MEPATVAVLNVLRQQPTGPFLRGWTPSLIGRKAGCDTASARTALAALEQAGVVFRPIPTRYALTGAQDSDFSW